MTSCIAAMCENNSKVIIASDRMITAEDLSIEFEHLLPKIECISNNCAVATAGDALVFTELYNILKDEIDQLKMPSIGKIVECIKSCYQTQRMRKIVEEILLPRGFKDFDSFYEMCSPKSFDFIYPLGLHEKQSPKTH